MKFLTFVKEYVQEHPHLSFKEAIRSDEVKCLYHKAGKATYCKDDDSKGVVVNVNCTGTTEDDEPIRKPKAIQQAYTAPRPTPPPRPYDPPGYEYTSPEQPIPPVPPLKQPIKRELPKQEKDYGQAENKDEDEKDYGQAENKDEDEISVDSLDEAKTQEEMEDKIEDEISTLEEFTEFLNSISKSGTGDTNYTDDFWTKQTPTDISRLMQPVDTPGTGGTEVLTPLGRANGAGIGKKKKTRSIKSILKSYTAPRMTPPPRQYLPPRPELVRQTNNPQREALMKILDAMRLILI